MTKEQRVLLEKLSILLFDINKEATKDHHFEKLIKDNKLFDCTVEEMAIRIMRATYVE